MTPNNKEVYIDADGGSPEAAPLLAKFGFFAKEVETKSDATDLTLARMGTKVDKVPFQQDKAYGTT